MSIHQSPVDTGSHDHEATGAGRLDALLVKTSRTFALSIPVLPEPTRREVTVAYLFFRIADTLEDATRWGRERKLQELSRFGALLDEPSTDAARQLAKHWTAEPPLDHEGYLELLADMPTVLQAHRRLSPRARDAISAHTRRTVDGMCEFVERESGGVLHLDDLADLRRYCYAVAGIVGELLTELFLLDRDGLQASREELRGDAATFGEALQLVNILKDSASDAREGRFYLPERLDRAEVLRIARDDLRVAGRYSSTLLAAGAPRGVIEFTVLPVLLAWAALDRVEADGPGAKVTRSEVMAIVARLQTALDQGTLGTVLPAAKSVGDST